MVTGVLEFTPLEFETNIFFQQSKTAKYQNLLRWSLKQDDEKEILELFKLEFTPLEFETQMIIGH